MPAGTYTVRVAVKGFNEGHREDVNVEDDATATIDVRLEIAPVEAEVKVQTQKGNVDPIYQSLRQLGRNDQDFAGNYAVVNNLLLKRDAGNFTLKSGELYFIAPVDDRVTAAVFIGDGELSLTRLPKSKNRVSGSSPAKAASRNSSVNSYSASPTRLSNRSKPLQMRR